MADETEKVFKLGDTVSFKTKLGKNKKGIIEYISDDYKDFAVKSGKDSYQLPLDRLEKVEPKSTKEIKPEDKTYKVIFRENRTHELFVGVEKIIFAPNGVNPIFPEKYTKGLPHSVISHVDFQSQKSYFTIVEIK